MKQGTKGEDAGAAPPHVLVVDDEPLAAEGLASFLRHRGYTAETASDGFDALEKFHTQPAEVVVTDIRMPRMDGVELARRLRAESPDLPIIGMTALPDIVAKQSDWRDWIDRMIEKPIDLRAIEGVLAGALRR